MKQGYHKPILCEKLLLLIFSFGVYITTTSIFLFRTNSAALRQIRIPSPLLFLPLSPPPPPTITSSTRLLVWTPRVLGAHWSLCSRAQRPPRRVPTCSEWTRTRLRVIPDLPRRPIRKVARLRWRHRLVPLGPCSNIRATWGNVSINHHLSSKGRRFEYFSETYNLNQNRGIVRVKFVLVCQSVFEGFWNWG